MVCQSLMARAARIGIGGRIAPPPPSRPGGLHPEPLTGPCVGLSTHTARATIEDCRLPLNLRAPPGHNPVGPSSTAMTRPLCSTGITPLHHYYRAVRPSPAHRYFQPRGFAACAFSLGIAGQVLKFHTRARMRVTPPLHRTPHGQSVGTFHANPGAVIRPRF